MKKISLVVFPALTIVLEALPMGAVCTFAISPTERVRETFSYFSLIPFGYANFAPLITAILTVVILLLSLISLKKDSVFNALFVLSIITAVISLMPLMYGLNNYSLVGALITIALVTESIFENRFKYADELARMGACIKVEGNTAIIDGVEKFTGAEVSAPDLRAGAALVIAGLAAEGVTVVDDIVYILRGYEDFDGKLRGLGAEIERVNNAKDIRKFRLRA